MSKNLTAPEFMSRLALNFGDPKDTGIYIERLSAFKPWELGKIFDNIAETYDRQGFPRLAAILSSAKSLGLPKQDPAETSADWRPSDCRLCGGSGMVASIWATSERPSPSGEFTVNVRERIHFGPYQQSAPFMVGDFTRTVSRCTCGANTKCVGGLPVFELGQDKAERAFPKRPQDGKSIGELRDEFRRMFGDALKNKSNPEPRQYRKREPGDEE